MNVTPDDLAQEIRRLDGDHTMGAGALAEGLHAFLAERERQTHPLVLLDPLLDALNKLSATPGFDGAEEGYMAVVGEVVTIFGGLPDSLVGPKRNNHRPVAGKDVYHDTIFTVEDGAVTLDLCRGQITDGIGRQSEGYVIVGRNGIFREEAGFDAALAVARLLELTDWLRPILVAVERGLGGNHASSTVVKPDPMAEARGATDEQLAAAGHTDEVPCPGCSAVFGAFLDSMEEPRTIVPSGETPLQVFDRQMAAVRANERQAWEHSFRPIGHHRIAALADLIPKAAVRTERISTVYDMLDAMLPLVTPNGGDRIVGISESGRTFSILGLDPEVHEDADGSTTVWVNLSEN